MRPALLASVLAGAVACSDAQWVFDSTVDAGAPKSDAARAFDAQGMYGPPRQPDANFPFDAGGLPDMDLDGGRGYGAGFGRCTTSQDCTTRTVTLYCNTMNQCVECTSDPQCGPGLPVCDLAIYRCVECNSRSGCQPGEICATMLHQCVVPCADGGESACPPGTGCITNVGYCSVCFTDRECNSSPVGHYCSPAGRCVECYENDQCRDVGAPWCNMATNECVQCLTSTDCAGNQVCDPNSNTCIGF
ncbi:MAG TPA: hypothetical protein VKU41_12400 [Polyangiaceae bacterium]|nr:hypothetical protein [Polyangiaceae bacterium]